MLKENENTDLTTSISSTISLYYNIQASNCLLDSFSPCFSALRSSLVKFCTSIESRIWSVLSELKRDLIVSLVIY